MNDPVAEPWERGLRAAALGGDAGAWRALYDSAFETVASYARWRGGSADLAEDIVQESWLAAARRLASFDPAQARFAAWVCGIASNVARAHVRKRSRDSSRVRALVTIPEPAAEPDTSDPERVALALAELPERYEAALRAKYLEQQSVVEMAAASRETEKAVESLLSRARQAFREAYARCGDSP
jgi:RNA polymerase sigma-70 factor (ECF subfamily)